jgi:hypothetical protein
MAPGQFDVGLKMSAEDVADGIIEREGREKISYGVLDPAAFAQDGGPSIAERRARRRVYFAKADNKRVARADAMGGWDQLRARLVGIDDEPRIFLAAARTSSAPCRRCSTTPHRPEDVDTEGEDHDCDRARYAVMSRPWIPKPPTPPRPKGFELRSGVVTGPFSMKELIDRATQTKREAA